MFKIAAKKKEHLLEIVSFYASFPLVPIMALLKRGRKTRPGLIESCVGVCAWVLLTWAVVATYDNFARRNITEEASPQGTVENDKELERKSALVYELLNDFILTHDNIDPTEQGRLDQAESYINLKLAERGEDWKFEAKSRTFAQLKGGKAK